MTFGADYIEFEETGLNSPLINLHLSLKAPVESFSHFPFNQDGSSAAIEDRRSFAGRELLVSRLKGQNEGIQLSKASVKNIDALSSTNAFCVTTGHQLCLLTGPLYFIHKIISTIKLCTILKGSHPGDNFVPVFWMASEDHDLAEVDHFNAFGQRFQWHTEQKGAVGRMDLEGVEYVLKELNEKLDTGDHSKQIMSLIKEAFAAGNDLAGATRHFVNALFGEFGLVIIDGDDRELKKAFAPVMEKEIRTMQTQELIRSTIEAPEWNYKVQMTPRPINLFYLEEDRRDRIKIDEKNNGIEIAERKLTTDELIDELYDNPEKFSPNVALRPVFQEYVLPNIAYVGGGGELAYWLQLKSTFEQFEMKMPVLVLRDHVLWIKEKVRRKMKKCGLELSDLFKNTDELITEKVAENRADEVFLNGEKEALKELFGKVCKKARELEPTLERSALAEEARVVKSIDRLQKRMLRAAKRQEEDLVRMIEEVKAEVFPNGTFQERQLNFLELYLELGSEMFELLIGSSDPFRKKMVVLTETTQ